MADGPKVGLLERHGPALGLLLVLTVGFGVVLAKGGSDPSQVGRAYVLAAGAVVVLSLVLELRRLILNRSWGADRPATPTPQLPPQLETLQDALRASRVNRGQFQLQAVPLLREVAIDRLQLLGISLDKEPERAGRALGEELASALAPEHRADVRVLHRGPRQRELEALIAGLEAVGR
ncbi:MAG: hypothetical protein ACRENY_00545 [Candidatus Dormibacteria bacterium]